MHGVSGTSKTGAKHYYYYYCKEQRAERCSKRPDRKEVGRERGHGHPQGISGRQREPRVNRCGRGQILRGHYKGIGLPRGP